MNNFELREEVNQFGEIFGTFEKLVKYRKRLGMDDDQMAIDLCAFYAIWSACKVLRCVYGICNIETTSGLNEDDHGVNYGELLSQYDSIYKAGQDLLLAVDERKRTVALAALNKMSVFSFCPMPERVFSKMEDVAGRVTERIKPVFLVDLALFAVGCGDFQRAYRFAQRARGFGLRSRELYNVLVIEGLVALDSGRVEDAVQCADRSMVACQADVDSSIECSLLPPNLELARKLLDRGEKVVVLRYLGECQKVWQLYASQIEEWIQSIERGNKPKFRSAEIAAADRMSRRINVQWIRALSLAVQAISPEPRAPMSPAQVLAERKRRQMKAEEIRSAHIKRKLKYLEEDVVNSDDSP